MAPKPPKRRLSLQDLVLIPAFYLGRFFLDFTAVRLYLALSIYGPIYAVSTALSVLPNLIVNSRFLLTRAGRSLLVLRSDSYRRSEAELAARQFAGEFTFREDEFERAPRDAIRHAAAWWPNVEEMEVCGIKAAVIYEKPDAGWEGPQNGDTAVNGDSVVINRDGVRSRGTIVMLHGNPSWSFMWRNVIPQLTAAGYEVYAHDWLGHGLSDKPTNTAHISFELHMHTLRTLFSKFSVPTDATIVAHDWGGCIALCTAPYLSWSMSPRIFCLNTFFPPRPHDVSTHYYALYLLWFFSTGILGGYIPEWAVMRFMAPSAPTSTTWGYEAPYECASSIKAKSSVGRFAHMVPGFPDSFLHHVRHTPAWRLFEGLCGPGRFTNFNAQAALAKRDVEIRKWWARCADRGWTATVVFGDADPLLKDFKHVLEDTIDKRALVEAPAKGWIPGAGHYPVEEKPGSVASRIKLFMEMGLAPKRKGEVWW